MIEISAIFSLAAISLLGAISPGPDFAVVSNYALRGLRRSALFAALGISAALLIHSFGCAFGIALLLIESPILFRWIQILGSCYLGYLGIRLLIPSKGQPAKIEVKSHRSFLDGLLTNLLNPKATLFVFGIFTQFSNPGESKWVLAIYAFTISIVAASWFVSVALLMTHEKFKKKFSEWQTWITKTMGIVLLTLALYILTQAATALLS